jgi:hypothetical protein
MGLARLRDLDLIQRFGRAGGGIDGGGELVGECRCRLRGGRGEGAAGQEGLKAAPPGGGGSRERQLQWVVGGLGRDRGQRLLDGRGDRDDQLGGQPLALRAGFGEQQFQSRHLGVLQ